MRTDAEKFATYSIEIAPGIFFPALTSGLNATSKRTLSAQAFHVGIRYRIPWEILNNAKIGIEYNRGAKYWQGYNDSSEDPLNKLNTNGNVWDVYYIQPLNKHLMLRFGHTMVQNHYENLLITTPTRVDEIITNTYMLLDAKFF